MGTWKHREILEGNKGAGIPPPTPEIHSLIIIIIIIIQVIIIMIIMIISNNFIKSEWS